MDNDLRKIIGDRILQRRKELHLSQKYVADRLGVDTSTFLRYEKGISDNTKTYILEGISRVFDVSVDWLRGDTDNMETSKHIFINRSEFIDLFTSYLRLLDNKTLCDISNSIDLIRKERM